MIHLFTGVPGVGKTAFVVSELAKIKGRPIFVMGIPELKIPHEPVPPVADWTRLVASKEDASLMQAHFTFPPNSIIVIDECQTVYRPRSAASKVPDHVAAFETHRHTGVDFWLISQSTSFVDANIRKVTTRHVHFHPTFMGTRKLEWRSVGDPESVQSRQVAASESYKPPRSAFALYKSSELHTKVSFKTPKYVYIFGIAAVLTVVIAFYSYQRVQAKKLGPASSDSAGRLVTGSILAPEIKSASDYASAYVPRLAGLPHTAPAYDELTKPVVIPEPVGCISTAEKCRCITQQNTTYDTTEAMCRQLVKNLFFMPWKKPSEPTQIALASNRPAGDAVSLRTAAPEARAEPSQLAPLSLVEVQKLLK